MSHCISIYILKKEEIRNEKIDSIIDDKKNQIKFTEMDEGLLATQMSSQQVVQQLK